MASHTKKLKISETPLELVERIKTTFLDTSQVSRITGFSKKQLDNLTYSGVVKSDYYFMGDKSYYSYNSLIELFLVKRFKEYKQPLTTLKHARKTLEKLGKSTISIVSKQVVFCDGQLFLVDRTKLGCLIISLSKKHSGQLNLNVIGFEEIENEVNESLEKNHINIDFKNKNKYSYV
jgi:hypothetical protein